jgi:hypothetical protein
MQTFLDPLRPGGERLVGILGFSPILFHQKDDGKAVHTIYHVKNQVFVTVRLKNKPCASLEPMICLKK